MREEVSPAALDLRCALRTTAMAVTVVTCLDKRGGPYGTTIGSFSSLSLDPPLVVWNLQRQTWCHSIFEDASYFAVNVLASDQERIARRFATPDTDRFAETETVAGMHGLPLIGQCLAWIECERAMQYPGGDHSIFVGRVLRARSFEKSPLIYCQGRYRT